MRRSMDVTYFTVSDRQYFVGTVALLNSLRLTGNWGELVVLDCGLTHSQCERLGGFCNVVPVPTDEQTPRALYKPYAAELGPSGVVVFFDSDLIMTASLEGVIDAAAAGWICAFSDQLGRCFPEWQSLFGLAAPVRRDQAYIATGLVAFSTLSFPTLLPRWREACQLVPRRLPRDAYRPFERSLTDPAHYLDQDALNAILMSEVPARALQAWDPTLGPRPSNPATVADASSLRCQFRGHDTLVLRYAGGPKPWDARGWSGEIFDAFVELLPRVLLAEDVTLRLDRREIPIWIRGGARGRASLRTLRAAADSGRWIVSRLPGPLRERVFRGIRTRVWRRRFS